MADRKKRSKKNQQNRNIDPSKNSWSDFLRLDESYTSLILGIIVVIIASILLVSFVKNKHTQSLHQQTSSIATGPTSYLHNLPLTISPTQIASGPTTSEEITPIPTVTNAPTVTLTPSPMSIETVTLTSQARPTIVATPTTHVTSAQAQPIQTHQIKGGGTYTVKSGDDLWHIAEKVYGSGYNWVDIAKANNLTNPGDIYSGNVLQLPKVATIIVQTATPTTNQQPQLNNNIAQYGPTINTNTYTVQKGDSLWTIAQRAYKGDGNQWTKIATINHLANPSDIYSGNVLQIPR